MFTKFWSLLNPRRWFGKRPAALPLSALPHAFEEQESPEPEQPIAKTIRESSNCSASSKMSIASAKSEMFPYRSESASPERNLDYDVEEVTQEKEPKLHELSDRDSSCDDDDDDEDGPNTSEFKTPPNLQGPLRRLSYLNAKKRKRSESSDQDSATIRTKKTKKSSQNTIAHSVPLPNSNESMEIVEGIKRDTVDKETDTPISVREIIETWERKSIKKYPYTAKKHLSPALTINPTLAHLNRGEKVTTSTPNASAENNLNQKAPATSSSLKSPTKKRAMRESTPSSASVSKQRSSPAPPIRLLPRRSCRAMTVSPSRIRDTVTPTRSVTRASTGKRGPGRSRKNPLRDEI